MNYEEWAKSVPESIRGDALWRIEAYRLALFASDIGWHDVTKLMKDRRTIGLADQLYRALGAISSDIGEGFSRSSGKDKARFYEYALGSARESRDWYWKGRFVLGEHVTTHRLDLITHVIRLLITMIPDQRGSALRELPTSYGNEPAHPIQDLATLLQNIPLPPD